MLTTRWLARIGYFCLTILLLQVLSLVIISLLQYTFFNYDPQLEYPVIKTPVNIELASAILPERPMDTPLLTDLMAWSALITIFIIILIYTANITSSIIKWGMMKFFKRITIGNLFATKFILIGIGFALLALFPLLLPVTELLLLMNAVLTLLAYLVFGAQFYYVRLNKTPIKDVL